MTVDYSIRAQEEITDREKAGLTALKTAVYPPEPNAEWPGREREWARPGWMVLVSRETNIVSCTGIVLTEASVDGQMTVIGGVGGIATHPDHRGRGYAAVSVDEAIGWMRERGAGFALLVCRDALVPYYAKHGWRLFEGVLRVTQFGEPEIFEFNEVMVRPVCGDAPSSGIVDLQGPPW